jgi:hypothetical protein
MFFIKEKNIANLAWVITALLGKCNTSCFHRVFMSFIAFLSIKSRFFYYYFIFFRNKPLERELNKE